MAKYHLNKEQFWDIHFVLGKLEIICTTSWLMRWGTNYNDYAIKSRCNPFHRLCKTARGKKNSEVLMNRNVSILKISARGDKETCRCCLPYVHCILLSFLNAFYQTAFSTGKRNSYKYPNIHTFKINKFWNNFPDVHRQISSLNTSLNTRSGIWSPRLPCKLKFDQTSRSSFSHYLY